MSRPGPVILVGCGRLGSAIVEGWLATGTVEPGRLVVLSPSVKPIMREAAEGGARLRPEPGDLADACAVVLAVKPAKWRQAVAQLDGLGAETPIVSVMAGVRAADIAGALDGRPVARVMPTTAVAAAQGVAALWSQEPAALDAAHALFDPLADTVELEAEGLIDVATAVAGSGPAYVHAFTRALAQAGVVQGLDAESALRLARGALRSAAAADPSETVEALIARVASPGGTTEAGLKALNGDDALDLAVAAAVAAALARARELAGDQPA